MRFELTEAGGQWIVACDGVEIGCFMTQDVALESVATRLAAYPAQKQAALTVRFEKQMEDA